MQQVSALVELGAELAATDEDGDTPLDNARNAALKSGKTAEQLEEEEEEEEEGEMGEGEGGKEEGRGKREQEQRVRCRAGWETCELLERAMASLAS